MTETEVSRRTFAAIASVAAASLVMGVEAGAIRCSLKYAARQQQGRMNSFDFLSHEQALDVEALAALIIPSEEGSHPGARDAGVIDFIDHALATWAVPQRKLVIPGVDQLNSRARTLWPGAARFAFLDRERQLILIRDVDRSPFFETVRFLTVFGMFALPLHRGNRNETGWRLLGFENHHAWQPPFGYYDAQLPDGKANPKDLVGGMDRSKHVRDRHYARGA